MVKRLTLTSVKGLNAAIRALPKESRAELKEAATDISERVAEGAKANPNSRIGAYKLIRDTIRAPRSTIPQVKVGSKRRIKGRSKRPDPERQRLGEVVFGAEFGGSRGTSSLSAYYRGASTSQFRPHRGQEGYAIYPTFREQYEESVDRYLEALQDAVIDAVRRNRGR